MLFIGGRDINGEGTDLYLPTLMTLAAGSGCLIEVIPGGSWMLHVAAFPLTRSALICCSTCGGRLGLRMLVFLPVDCSNVGCMGCLVELVWLVTMLRVICFGWFSEVVAVP